MTDMALQGLNMAMKVLGAQKAGLQGPSQAAPQAWRPEDELYTKYLNSQDTYWNPSAAGAGHRSAW